MTWTHRYSCSCCYGRWRTEQPEPETTDDCPFCDDHDVQPIDVFPTLNAAVVLSYPEEI